MVRFVELGFGAAVVPRSAVTGHAGEPGPRELSDPAARHPVTLVHRRPAPSGPAARAFLALLGGQSP